MDILPKKDRPILFVAYPDMCIMDFSAPQTVFWVASKEMKLQKLSGYECHTVSMQGGLIRTSEGLRIDTQCIADFDDKDVDTVMVPGSFFMQELFTQSKELIDWIQHAAKKARRMTAVCNGAFLIAEAGLLTGKHAATHWITCDAFQQRFPDVKLDRESLFVRDGSVWTSAGVSACIDLSLALVEEDCGRTVAMNVAKELVVFLKRPGGQSQFSQLLRAQAEANDTFDDLHLWITNNLANVDITVEALAEQACMSPRNFARVYKQHTGRSPAKAVELFRLEAAKRLLEDSKQTLKQIARTCGFEGEERMRSTFLRNLSATPREYRERFSTTAKVLH